MSTETLAARLRQLADDLDAQAAALRAGNPPDGLETLGTEDDVGRAVMAAVADGLLDAFPRLGPLADWHAGRRKKHPRGCPPSFARCPGNFLLDAAGEIAEAHPGEMPGFSTLGAALKTTGAKGRQRMALVESDRRRAYAQTLRILADALAHPRTLVATAVAAKKYHTSRATLQRFRKQGRLHACRAPGKAHSKTATWLWDDEELARLFNPRQG